MHMLSQTYRFPIASLSSVVVITPSTFVVRLPQWKRNRMKRSCGRRRRTVKRKILQMALLASEFSDIHVTHFSGSHVPSLCVEYDVLLARSPTAVCGKQEWNGCTVMSSAELPQRCFAQELVYNLFSPTAYI
ncbi:hypothetical protein Tcan_01777, partial [Toxocara canis]